MKRVFVCSAYRGQGSGLASDVAANVGIARAACREVLGQGDAPFAPHLLYPDVLGDDEPEDRALGMAAGRAWLAMADEVLVVGPVSDGMREEIAAAELLGIAVRRVDLPNAGRATAWRRLSSWVRGRLPGLWEDRATLAAIVIVVLGFLLCPGR